MRSLNRYLRAPLRRPRRAPADPGARIGNHTPGSLVAGAACQAREIVRRCLHPLRSLFGPRATDPEIHAIAAASSATTSAARTDGTESAATDARRRYGPRRLIVRLLSATPTFSPQTT